MSSLLKKQIEKQNFPIFFDKNLTLKKWFPFLFQFLLTPLYGALWLGKYNIYNLPLSKKSKME